MDARKQDDRKVALALQQAGVEVNSVFDLVNARRAYPQAIPSLLKCLAEINEPVIKEGVVRALTVKEARGISMTSPISSCFVSASAAVKPCSRSRSMRFLRSRRSIFRPAQWYNIPDSSARRR